MVDEQVAELHLCEDCAQEKGAQMEQHFNLADLLAGLVDLDAPSAAAEGAGAKCPSCGMTYNDFRKLGKFGCGNCYEAFKKNLAPLLRRIHGSTQHLGKVPARAEKAGKLRDELAELRAKLEKAIKLEQFEEAAKLRDKMRTLEKKGEK